ncbi:MAG: phospholipid carrier-dependent glycosyltransferase, partial [Planctomycetota bacterium]
MADRSPIPSAAHPDRRSLPGAPQRPSGKPAVARSEWFCVAGILVLAAALRFAAPERLAVEHFDEGVYSSNLWFGREHAFQYPDRFLYAPPLLPAAIEWTLIVLGPRTWVPMLPAMALGTITVLGVWWLARQWYGGTAGCLAAFLVACSDYHILFSRTALTDAPMTCFLVFGLACAWRGFEIGRTRWLVLGGLAFGLAWWTKYNGWLGIAIVVAGTVAAEIERRIRRGTTAEPIKGTSSHGHPTFPGSAVVERPNPVWACILLTGISAAVWSPVWWSLQSVGGYGPVARNHAKYWLTTAEPHGGASTAESLPRIWTANARRHLQVQRYLEGAPSWAALLTVFAALTAWIRRAPPNCPTLRYADVGPLPSTHGDDRDVEKASKRDDRFVMVRRSVAAAVAAGGLSSAALLTLCGATPLLVALAAGGLFLAGICPTCVTPDDAAAGFHTRRRAFWWHAAWL